MDDGGLGPWIIVILLILFADYIAVAETALASASRIRMKTLVKQGNKKAGQVLEALDHFDRTISTILICTNIAHLAAASIITSIVARTWGLSAVTFSTLITSIVVFFVAEMLPKSIAKKYSDNLALVCIGPLTVLNKIFKPLSAVLSAIGNAASRLTKGDTPVSVTEDEIYDIIEDMTEDGSLDEEHGELISSALQFNDVTAEHALTPRVDVAAIDINDDLEKILELIKSISFSRLPVYEGSIDHIIGVLRIRSFIRAYLKHKDSMNLKELLDEPMFVPENASLQDLLSSMSKSRQSIAIVTDHHGGTVGIITMEDILEELVGEIWDEDDVVENAYTTLGDGCYLVSSEESVEDAFEYIGFDNPVDDEELINKRLGKWVYEHFQTIPHVQDTFNYHGVEVKVAAMEQNRIRRILLTYKKDKEGGEKK